MSEQVTTFPEQRELEVLRRLANCVRDAHRDGAGIFSLRTHRVEKWDETELPELLRTLDAVQGARSNYGRNWEVCPEDDEGVFILDGQRVKIVPVEPTERMVHDDSANDPPMSHPFGAISSDAIRYIYKQLVRVAPQFDLSKLGIATGNPVPDKTAEQSDDVAAETVAETAGETSAATLLNMGTWGTRSERLHKAIEEAEHKPGTWTKAVSQFGAVASATQDISNVLGGKGEQIIGSFGYKRDGWLATAAVNSLPELLEIARLAHGLVEKADGDVLEFLLEGSDLLEGLADKLRVFEAS
jgi:hypothetical protein